MFEICRNPGARLVGMLLAVSLCSAAVRAQEGADSGATDPDIFYLQENAKREGIIVRPSGLQIRIITRGTGDLPELTSTVVVHYEGRLVDGTIFDSSYERGKPTNFGIDDVIKGWTEALILMQVGSIWEISIPASIAYGDEGAGDAIPPGATLIFKVELLAIS